VRALVIIWILLWDGVMFWLIGRSGYLDGRHTLAVIVLLHALFALALPVWKIPVRWWIGRQGKAGGSAGGSGVPQMFAWVIFFLTIIPGIVDATHPPRSNRDNERAAAEWVRVHVAPGAVVCDLERLVGYYSGHPYERWHGLYERHGDPWDLREAEITAIETRYPGVALIFGRAYLPEESHGPPDEPATGKFVEIARFSSAVVKNSVYVLYARQGEAWQKAPPE
jgi:hypothetical protein